MRTLAATPRTSSRNEPHQRRGPVRYLFMAITFVGLLLWAAAAVGLQVGDGWAAFLACYGAITVGAIGWTVDVYRGTTPGIKNHGNLHRSIQSRGWLAWALFVALGLFYTAYYFLPQYFTGITRLADPLARALRGSNAIWFVYSYLYTMAILLPGIRMLMRYRHSPYQQRRTLSVMGFQLTLAFLVPPLLLRAGGPEAFLSYFWPLAPHELYPGTVAGRMAEFSGWGLALLLWALVALLVVTPVLTYLWGKRWYCSWVCGCGGLAETAGDPFRHLSSKSLAAWRFERWAIHLVLVVITLGTALLWIDHATGAAFLGPASSGFVTAYEFGVLSLLAGWVGVTFYPILGSRVWCRFFCPMAAILGIIQRFFSRFRITTNGGQCMSCGNCSTYCEMGIDVRSYAQRGANIVRASCVGCGLCSAVCPRGVLNLENGKTHADRFPGADRPLAELRRALTAGRRAR